MYLTDECFNGRIIRGVRRRMPDAPLVRARDVGLGGRPDPAVLEWAAANGHVVFSHDADTMYAAAAARVAAGKPMTGLFVVPQDLPIGDAIDEILIVLQCSEPEEHNGLIDFLPLKTTR